MSLTPTRRDQIITRSTGLLWGPTKAGKTTFLASLPRPILFIMCDPEGIASLPPAKDIHVIDLSVEDDSAMVELCRKKIPTYIETTELPIESVVLDSLTSLSLATLNKAIDGKVGASTRGNEVFIPSLETPGLAAYGARTNNAIDIARRVLKATKVREMHCWFTAHEDAADRDAKGNVLKYPTTLSDKAANGIGLQLSEIWWLHMDKSNKRKLAFAPTLMREPIGSRMISASGNLTEITLEYDPSKPLSQPHSLATWIKKWQAKKHQQLTLPELSD